MEARPLVSRRIREGLSLAAAGFLVLGLAVPVHAAAGLSLTTPFPGVAASPDSRVTFNLEVDANESGLIDLEIIGVPESWSASLHGGGLVVNRVLLNGSDPTEVRLDVDVPADATGTTRMTVIASDNESRVELPIDVTVEAEAEGEVSLSTDFPSLRGAAGTTFTFNMQVRNDRAEDLTYTGTAQGPPGWSITAQPTGQSQAVSATVTAGAEAGLTVTVNPPESAAAGTYPVDVVATVGTERIEHQLQVEITGSYSLEVSTPTQALSARGPSGATTEQEFTIINTGTAPVTAIELTSTPPSEWEVVFEPAAIESIPAGQTVTVKARITPSGEAIAGDYELTVRANGEEADADTEIRFTVEAGILGAVLGALLIAAAIAGLYWVFRRYGRR
jgi:uncharacterized membrane protein